MSWNKIEYVKVGDRKYKINTDYRFALKCNEIAVDKTIGDHERALAVIYMLFGDEGLECEDVNKLLELGTRYLNRDTDGKGGGKPDMDYDQDWGYIKASFMSDYGIAIDDVDMHYYDFIDYLSGLTENSALSRVRYIRNYDTKGLKGKELSNWNKMKKEVALRQEQPEITDEEKESLEVFNKLTGG